MTVWDSYTRFLEHDIASIANENPKTFVERFLQVPFFSILNLYRLFVAGCLQAPKLK